MGQDYTGQTSDSAVSTGTADLALNSLPEDVYWKENNTVIVRRIKKIKNYTEKDKALS